MRIALLIFGFSSWAICQTAVGPSVPPCPADQIIRATQQAPNSPFYKLSCIKLDATVKLDAAAVPPTVKAIAQAPAPTSLPPCEPYYGVFQESPIGIVDGANRIFTLSAAPINNSQIVVVDGSVRAMGVDWTTGPADNQITFTIAPVAGAVIRIYYRA